MEAEGVVFRTGAYIGADPSWEGIRKDFDAVILACGATRPRDLPVPGRELAGVAYAMEFLKASNRVQEGDRVPGQILAEGKNVVVIGGGDTGADCVGTALRQGAKSVTSLELLPKPPEKRAPDNPWPEWAKVYRSAPAHEEGGERVFSALTKKFTGENGVLKRLHGVRVEWKLEGKGPARMEETPGGEFVLEADLVLLAMGFTGPEKNPIFEAWGLALDERSNLKCDADKMTNVPGVFTAGDMTRGQSLIVWAIAEGRAAAKGCDRWLMGETSLP
jgi:glutamate synthase (NADPH/NADH) small chain